MNFDPRTKAREEEENNEANAEKRVITASRNIFNAVSSGVVVRNAKPCPHGNYATAPYNHPWFCDGCWLELQDALNELDAIES